MVNEKNCYKCRYRKMMRSLAKGVKIPDGTGKCTRPGGHCDPDIVCGKIGEGAVIRRMVSPCQNIFAMNEKKPEITQTRWKGGDAEPYP